MEYSPVLHARWETKTRYYTAHLQEDLLGDWIVITTNGGRKSRLGNLRTRYVETREEGLKFIDQLNRVRLKRGYLKVV